MVNVIPGNGKRILVIDEPGFARVCGALLTLDGYRVETPTGEGSWGEDFDLVITSYPYGEQAARDLVEGSTPVLVMADCLSSGLLDLVRSLRYSWCMIKPIDFEQFPAVIQRLLHYQEEVGGHEII